VVKSSVETRPANDGKEDPKWKKLTEVTKEVDEFIPAKVSVSHGFKRSHLDDDNYFMSRTVSDCVM
jgi:hypothetical protein